MLQKVLVIDDSPSIHALLKARLTAEPIELLFAGDGEQGLKMAASLLPDVILLDIDMPEPDGLEVCRRLKADERTNPIPVIFLTGETSTEQKIRGLELGATDYITKPFDAAELRARIRATLRAKYLMDLLSRKALLDGLTGLWNRVYFESRLCSELALIRNTGRPLSCLMIDLDRFKQLNDEYGHLFGDDVLKGMGRILGEICRPEDVVCRYGGEEFVILCPSLSSHQAAQFAEQIRSAVQSQIWSHNGKPVAVTCSIGVADLRHTPPPTVVELADQALYHAKSSGRNRVTVADAASSTRKVA
jgi:diguanylate cyclase (GGDEF)-like protein